MVYQILEEIKTQLTGVDGAKSIRIGLERGIGAKDAPFIRIVPTRFKADNDVTDIEFQVVFGFDIKNRDHEELYRAYFEMEQKIREVLSYRLPSANCIWIETVTDEDKVPNLKTGILLFVARGVFDYQGLA